ncbi:MAG: M61 family metallopeptidase [Panacagrimonas sp.]
MRIPLLIAIGLSTSLRMGLACAAPQWQWEDRFSSAEKEGLIEWIEHSDQGMTRLFGPLPYDYTVHFHRSQGGEPVPWGEARKDSGRNVFFHVNTRYPWDAFKRDWTASHELSHLMFPYLGSDSRWFSEGIASYLQYQIMYASGAMSWQQVTDKYAERFDAAGADQARGQMSIVEQSRGVRHGGYVRLYWGGAAYFLNADRRLFEEKGIRLTDVIGKYMACCFRNGGVDDGDMIETFDRISDGRIFSQTYARTVASPGFPDTRTAMVWLRNQPPSMHRPPAP